MGSRKVKKSSTGSRNFSPTLRAPLRKPESVKPHLYSKDTNRILEHMLSALRTLQSECRIYPNAEMDNKERDKKTRPNENACRPQYKNVQQRQDKSDPISQSDPALLTHEQLSSVSLPFLHRVTYILASAKRSVYFFTISLTTSPSFSTTSSISR